jgi:predicted MFS family arabinose efflux permease
MLTMTPSSEQRFTTLQLTVILTICVVGGIMVNLQPLLLGELLAAGQLSAPQLGQAAMCELLGMALSLCAAGLWMPLTSQRSKFAVVGVLLAAMNLCTMISVGYWILAERGAAGILEGLMLWLTVALFTRITTPARMNAIYLFALSITGFCVASALSLWVVPRFGIAGGFAGVTLLSLLAAACALLLPTAFIRLSDSPDAASVPGGHATLPSARGATGLLALFTFIAAVLAVWVYISPLGLRLGLAAPTVNLGVSLAIAAEIVGALLASVMSQRFNYRTVLQAGMGAAIILYLLMWHLVTAASFIACTMAFGFLWYLMMPFLMPFIIGADPSRRAALLSGSAQMFGCAAGPALASLFVMHDDVRPVLAVGIALFVLTMILIFLVERSRRDASAAFRSA